MGDKKPDIHKFKKKHKVDELVAALRYPDATVRAEAAAALGEIGDRGSAASVKAFAAELTAEAAHAGHWDPGEASRLILKAWAAGAAKNADRELKDYAARVSARVESQEVARREALLSGVRQMPPEIDEEIPARPEPEATPVADATLVVAAALAAGTSQATMGSPVPVSNVDPAVAEDDSDRSAGPVVAAMAAAVEPVEPPAAEAAAMADGEATKDVLSPLVTPSRGAALVVICRQECYVGGEADGAARS